jgi:hypothetical protein
MLQIIRKNILSRLGFIIVMNILSPKITKFEESFLSGYDALSLGKQFLAF